MTATTLPRATSGDIGDSRLVTLGEDNAGTFTPVVFTGVVTSVEAHVWRDGVAPVTLTASFDDEAAGLLRVALGTAGQWLPDLTLGTSETVVNFQLEYQVTFTDGSVLTWGPDVLPVRRQGA